MLSQFTPPFKCNNAAFKYLTFAFFVCLLFSCQNNFNGTPSEILEIDDPIVKDAKVYYDEHYLNNQRSSRQGASSKKNLKPDWKSAKSKSTSFGDFVEIPVTIDNKRIAYTSKTHINSDKIAKSEEWKVNSSSKLLMFRAKDSQAFTSEISTLTENVASSNKRANLEDINFKNFNDFSGYAFFESLDDTSIRGYEIEKGKITKHFILMKKLRISDLEIYNLASTATKKPSLFG